MATRRRQHLVTLDDVPLPPYEWSHARSGVKSAWGVNLPISERHDLQLMAQRGTAGRWTWTLTIYSTGSTDQVTRIARGVQSTLTAAKPAAEAAARTWLADQLELPDESHV
ncbi:hypothetical protein [Tessaracoccus sp. Y1736]